MSASEHKKSGDPHKELGRRRAEHALGRIEKYAADKAAKKKEYVSYVKSAPAMIRMNGLGQTLAIFAARSKADPAQGEGGDAPDAYRDLYKDIQDWFASDHCPLRGAVTPGGEILWLLKVVIGAPQADYLLIQAEAALYVEWLKKFAMAFLTEEARNG